MNLEEAVVVPLVPLETEPSTEAMLRMLLNREALLIDRTVRGPQSVPSGLIAQSGGAFAKALGQAMGHLSRSTPADSLYRVVMPTGSVARDLVPAVGGGFRGIVRGAGSAKISGQVRLVPAVAGFGATAAAGPLIATVGLAVAGEMMVQHQTQKKLAGIRSALSDLQARADERERSTLSTAGQQARRVAAYLLDQARIPSISSAAHAFGDLDSLTNSYIDQLDRWTAVAERHARAERVYAPELLTALVGKREDPVGYFEQRVSLTYEALALRARVVLLEKVAAEFSNPDRSLPHIESVLRDELSAIAERHTQLEGLLDDLSVMQLDSSKVPIAFAGKGTLAARTSFSRLARALHATPDSLPVLTDSDQTMLELAPSSEGLSVMTPRETDGRDR